MQKTSKISPKACEYCIQIGTVKMTVPVIQSVLVGGGRVGLNKFLAPKKGGGELIREGGRGYL